MAMTLDELLRQLGRQTVRVGSSTSCEICLPKTAPIAAEIIHHGSGKLSFVPTNSTSSRAGGKPLQAGVAVPFDFSIPYEVDGVVVPNAHPALCLMTMGRGHVVPRDEQLILGRDAERCHLILNSPGVSGLHATLSCEHPLTITDHGSKSGSWLGGRRLAPQVAHPLSEDAVVVLGPLPFPVELARPIYQALSAAPRAETVERTQAMPRRTLAQRAVTSPTATRHKTVMGTIKMSQAKAFTVGRTTDNDIVLDYAQVAAHHAKLIQLDQQTFVEDSGSEPGTFVRGSRVRPGQRAQVNHGERIYFGPIPTVLHAEEDTVSLIVEDQKGWAGRPLFDVAAAGISVEVPDRNDKTKRKRLLSDVHFKAQPGDFIALMGPSGSGKTTLLHVLTGYTRPSAGEVMINGAPLPSVFDSLRGSIGYVPQDDIIHPELTVHEAVRYSARFRLPHDYSEEEIERRVQLTLSQLGLESVSSLQIGKPEQKVISGGQRKRVNIAMELVTDPVLIFLDEPTSGLAADDATALIDLLATLAKEHGKTIISTIHQPARDEYERFNLTLVLGHGGIPLYFGPTTDAYRFFEAWRGPLHGASVDNPRDMFAELKERETRFEKELPGRPRQAIREAVSAAFAQEYLASSIFKDMINAGRSVDRVSALHGKLPGRASSHGQLTLLIQRYLKVKLRDRVGTAILLLQAPLIGVLLSLVFWGQKPAVVYWCLGALNELAQTSSQISEASDHLLAQLTKTQDNTGAIFFLVIAAVWFGTSNAAREIVSERAILRRERMVHLHLDRYVLSKFVVLGALSALQCAVLLGIVFVCLQFSGGASALLTALGMMVLTAWCSVALGLLLSATVTSSEAAMALTPIALIPQVVLGGLMVPLTTNAWLKWPMLLIPARWGFEGVVRPERLAISQLPAWRIHLPGTPESVSDFIEHEHFLCALAQMESSQLTGAWGFSYASYVPALALFCMTTLCLGLVTLALRRR